MIHGLNRFITPALIVFALVLGGGAVAYKLHSREVHKAAEQADIRNAAKADADLEALIPKGFTRAETSDGIAYGTRWTKPKKCPDSANCYGLEIVATQNCPTFLAAQIVFAGTVASDVGTSRASAKATKAGKAVELLFPVVLPKAHDATIETVTCS